MIQNESAMDPSAPDRPTATAGASTSALDPGDQRPLALARSLQAPRAMPFEFNYPAPLTSIVSSALCFIAISAFASEARAGTLDACGDIFINAGAQCEVLTSGGCEANCTPPAMTAVCAAEGYASCDGECNASVDASCTAECQGSCVADCEIEAGEFDCGAHCDARCSGECEARCEGAADGAECRASCQATCGAECSASCEATPPSAACETKCEASCQGGCQAEANLDCQVDCQADFYAECKADFQGGCEVQCQQPQGALFCNGQFISTSSLDSCIDALRNALDANVEVSAEAEASASLSCAVSPEQRPGAPAFLGLGLLCLAAICGRR